MNIIINGRHLEITPSLRSYAEEKIGRFDKYISKISEAIVTLGVEKYRHKVEVLLKINGVMIQAESVTGDAYSAIDEVVEKLEKQIVRYKEKLHSYRKAEKRVLETVKIAPPEKGRIIKLKRFEMKPMDPEDAINQMELLDKDFFVFANRNSGDMNVVYRRKDGNYGLIEPLK